MKEVKEYFAPKANIRRVPATFTNTALCGDLFGNYKPSIFFC